MNESMTLLDSDTYIYLTVYVFLTWLFRVSIWILIWTSGENNAQMDEQIAPNVTRGKKYLKKGKVGEHHKAMKDA